MRLVKRCCIPFRSNKRQLVTFLQQPQNWPYYTGSEPSLYTLSELMGNESPRKKRQPHPQTQPQGLQLQSLVKEAIRSRLKDPIHQSHYQALLDLSLRDSVKDRALGCLFGAFMGDALGSYCEFSPSIGDNLIDLVMSMPGGGVFNLQPGQLTDDSEMAVHLMQGLNQIDTALPLPTQQHTLIKYISEQYVNWLESQPFDIGITCRKGIKQIKAHKYSFTNLAQNELPPVLQRLYSEVAKQNKDSESNGSLMRITPMAVLFSCSKLQPAAHRQFITNEIRLIHSKDIIHTASYLWINTLARVIQRTNDRPQTFKDIFNKIETLDVERHLQDWFQVAKQEQRMNGTVKIGWAKIAWSYGMKQLYRLGNSSQVFDQAYYKRVISEVIKEAGDTDTNACIVGGLLGSLVGFSKLPPWYIKKMMEVQFGDQHSQQYINRPSRYEPLQVLLLALQFIDKCSKHKPKTQRKA